MKYFFIAGERSGDLHAGNLIKALREQDKAAGIIGYGGNYMKEAGMRLIAHYNEISFMGFLEVVKNLGVIRKRIKECERAILNEKPDVLVLVDFPGFNLRMAKFAKKHGIKTAYYISPKIWAWKESRIKQLRRYVDKMFVIFPFEVPYFQQLNYPVSFVGNPLVEYIESYDADSFTLEREGFDQVIAFLPGSRVQEVTASIHTIVELSKKHPRWLFAVAAVDNLPADLYGPLQGIGNVEVHIGKTYEILNRADASVTTSGTATLETLLWNVPQLVCYRTSQISYWIAKRLVKIKYISLVNLVADKEVVKEFIQDDYNLDNLSSELELMLNDIQYRKAMLNEYKFVKSLLTEKSASKETSRLLTDWLGSL